MRIVLSSIIVVVVFVSLGCGTSHPIPDAPLPETKQQALKNYLTGTWSHKATATAKYADKNPVKHARISWTFKKNGTGIYHEKVVESGMKNSRKFRWSLDGKNLILSPPDRDVSTYYRVEEWGKQKMVWFNYGGSNYFFVSRGSPAR